MKPKKELTGDFKYMSVLFVNACVRKNSRTLVLAREIMKDIKDEITEISLNDEGVTPLNRKELEKRDMLVSSQQLDDGMLSYARQFAQADEIIIAAPYWDLGIPAILKAYLEQITVSGITFKYNMGKPQGLCRAKKLTFVTTSGGEIFVDFGYSYIKTLARTFYGIEETVCYRATNMDVDLISCDDVISRGKISVIK